MVNILLMEDDASDAYALTEELETMGHVVTWARNCDDALLEAEKTSFDIVVTDMFVRDRDGVVPRGGLTLISALRSAAAPRPTLPSVPIISVSAAFDARQPHAFIEENARVVGATRTFSKPVDALALHDVIEECMRIEALRTWAGG